MTLQATCGIPAKKKLANQSPPQSPEILDPPQKKRKFNLLEMLWIGFWAKNIFVHQAPPFPTWNFGPPQNFLSYWERTWKLSLLFTPEKVSLLLHSTSKGVIFCSHLKRRLFGTCKGHFLEVQVLTNFKIWKVSDTTWTFFRVCLLCSLLWSRVFFGAFCHYSGRNFDYMQPNCGSNSTKFAKFCP